MSKSAQIALAIVALILLITAIIIFGDCSSCGGKDVVSQTRDIKLYFYNNQRDRDESGNILCSTKGLVPVNRSIPLTVTPIQDAVRQLLGGPDSVEKLITPGTEFPLTGLTLTNASLSNGILILTFDDPENKTGGGSCRVNILRAQIEATVKQFDVVKEVRLAPDGLFQP